MSEFDSSRITPEQFREHLPRACMWVLEQERFIIRHGVRLTAVQLSDAKRAGVGYPERVRLLRVEEIPRTEHVLLRAALEAMKINTPLTPSLTLRYGIFIRSDHWNQRWWVVHELAHTAQYERLGGVRAFLECFVYQCLLVGYPSAPMEQEAIATAQRICGPLRALRSPAPITPRGPSGFPSHKVTKSRRGTQS